tara:strand:- start:189 stop:812 length:624 start_codon:yes stop_codon:yes gene_type:complete
MVNIQIRGNLIRLDLKTVSNSEEFISIINSNSHIDLKNYIKKTRSEQKVIYQNTLPVIDSDCEISVTSFENDNYYDDGYTFFRSNLNELNSKDEDLKIPLELFKNDYFLLDIKYGYGAGFETEIMDLNYENFEAEKLKILKTKIFGNQKNIVQSLKLNYLNLVDLGRNKFDFSKTQSFIFNNKYDEAYLLSEKKLSNQVEVIMKIEW